MALNGDHFLIVTVLCGPSSDYMCWYQKPPMCCVLVTGDFCQMLDSKHRVMPFMYFHACVLAFQSLRVCKSQGQCSLKLNL